MNRCEKVDRLNDWPYVKRCESGATQRREGYYLCDKHATDYDLWLEEVRKADNELP